ncbi:MULTISPECIES: hypothetical protein [Enterobacteriaceae]|uniref:hypothetical protein n=1 Tax=Enterobacteriaceae TaxID=543 RepID=UPI000BE51971|nr:MULTISPECIES: hypothetical protein [Enterobacteriaceae]EEV8626479.1 hypothetical protein [Escherichia coli]EFA4337683.1 hypothetical protein [Escherichia coli]EFC5375952.1 hypothetical protein [Escherichia coli]EFN7932710.1 hypothetical protein [Escherichia coli]EFN8231849.1 hypothetical protein [Escherichia coli]
MTWQNVPYAFEKTTGELTLVIEKLPPIEISSSFPFETFITALAGVIAAGITGWVAYRAIKENFALATLQAHLNTNKELAQQIRFAGAEHVTDVIMLASTFEQWHLVGNKNMDILAKGVFPEEIQVPIKAAEISKNKLLLLIRPDEEGCKLITLTADLQKALKVCFTKGYFTPEEKKSFIDAQNAFIFGCHEYINQSLS